MCDDSHEQEHDEGCELRHDAAQTPCRPSLADLVEAQAEAIRQLYSFIQELDSDPINVQGYITDEAAATAAADAVGPDNLVQVYDLNDPELEDDPDPDDDDTWTWVSRSDRTWFNEDGSLCDGCVLR